MHLTAEADTRALAATALARVLGGQSLNTALPSQLQRVTPRDRGLLQQLCYGTLRHYPRLVALLRPLLNKPLKDKDLDIQALLLLGLYQLDDTRVPEHAAVSATVTATAALRKDWAQFAPEMVWKPPDHAQRQMRLRIRKVRGCAANRTPKTVPV